LQHSKTIRDNARRFNASDPMENMPAAQIQSGQPWEEVQRMKITVLVDRFRQWLDGDEQIEVQGAQTSPPPSSADQFIVAVAREVGEVMLREAFTPPGEPTYIPREYIIFLSKEDDQAWHGHKREGLSRGLTNALTERAREVGGLSQLQTGSISLELRVDGTLEPGKFRVQPIWDPDEEKTVILNKGRQPQPAPQPDDDSDGPTLVRHFSLRVEKCDAAGQVTASEVRPIFDRKVTIGRGKDSGLQISGDREISRHHATLIKNPDGSFTLECHGQNPIRLADGSELPGGQSAPLRASGTFRLASYQFTIL
jgi:hypothetical protein